MGLNLGLLKNRNLTDARWLMYYLRSPFGNHQLKQNRGGTSQPYISRIKNGNTQKKNNINRTIKPEFV